MKRIFVLSLIFLSLGTTICNSQVNDIQTTTRVRVRDSKNRIRVSIPTDWKYVSFGNENSSEIIISQSPDAFQSFTTKLLAIKVSNQPIAIPSKYLTNCKFKEEIEIPIVKDNSITSPATKFSQCGRHSSNKDWFTVVVNKYHKQYRSYHQTIYQRAESNPEKIDDVLDILNTANLNLIIE